jgi:hypothetical protein
LGTAAACLVVVVAFPAAARDWRPWEGPDGYYWYDRDSVREDRAANSLTFSYSHSKGGHPDRVGVYFTMEALLDCGRLTVRTRSGGSSWGNPSRFERGSNYGRMCQGIWRTR